MASPGYPGTTKVSIAADLGAGWACVSQARGGRARAGQGGAISQSSEKWVGRAKRNKNRTRQFTGHPGKIWPVPDTEL